MSFIYEGFLAKVSKSGSFLTHLFTENLFQPYFFKIRVIFDARTPNQDYWMILQTIIALYLPPLIPSTHCSFVLLPLSDIFDTRDNDSMGHRTWTLNFEWFNTSDEPLWPHPPKMDPLWPYMTRDVRYGRRVPMRVINTGIDYYFVYKTRLSQQLHLANFLKIVQLFLQEGV